MYATESQGFSIDRSQAKRQLILLGYKPSQNGEKGDNVYIRAFVPDKAGGGVKLDRLNWEEVEQIQREGKGIYFVVNGGGHTDSDVKVCRAIFYEHDDLPKEIQLRLWQDLGLPEPTFQVDTGGKSIHSYWVFQEPIPVEKWSQLQKDLLEYSGGDRKIHNPSRVMRLAGAWHMATKQQSFIAYESGNRYTFEELRAVVPEREAETSTYQPPKVDLNNYDVPLTELLKKSERDLLNSGVSSGSRNDEGARLARNLLGTYSRLPFLGIRCSETPRQLFDQFCQRCSPPIDSREADQIWKSAERSNPTATLSDDAIENCAKAWLNRESRRNEPTAPPIARPGSLVTHPKFNPEPLSELERAIEGLLTQDLKRSQLQIKLAELGRKFCLPLADVSKLFRQKEEEAELSALSHDSALDVERLLNAQKSALNLFDILPLHLAKPIVTLAHRFNLKPEAYLLALLAQTNSLFKNGSKLVDPFPATDWTEIPPTIFAALVAPPGAGKSPLAKSMILKPMQHLKESAQKEYDAAMEDYESEMQEWTALDKKDRGPKPEQPAKRYYHFHSQSTLEGILCQLSKQPYDGAMLFADELEGYFSGQNQYKSGGKKKGGGGNDKAILLSLWSGIAPEGVMRKSEGGSEAYSLPAGANLGIYGGIQPEILAEVLGSGTDPQGEFGRFLYVSQPLTVTRLADFIGQPKIELPLAEIYQRIEREEAQIFYLSPDAQKTLVAFHDNWCATRVMSESRPALINYLKKLPEHAARIAMGLQALWQGGEIIETSIMKAAIAVAAYSFHQLEALLIEQKGVGGELSPSLAKIISFVQKKQQTSFREISKTWDAKHRPQLADLKDWCRTLAEMDYLEISGEKIFAKNTGDNLSPPIPSQLETFSSQSSELGIGLSPVIPSYPQKNDEVGITGDTSGDKLNPLPVRVRGQSGDTGDKLPPFEKNAPKAESDEEILVQKLLELGSNQEVSHIKQQLAQLKSTYGFEKINACCKVLKKIDKSVFEKTKLAATELSEEAQKKNTPESYPHSPHSPQKPWYSEKISPREEEPVKFQPGDRVINEEREVFTVKLCTHTHAELEGLSEPVNVAWLELAEEW